MAFELRDYQKEDIEAIEDDFLEKIDNDKYQKAVVDSIMGTGKTNLMIYWSHMLAEHGLSLIVVVAPTLAILTQTAERYLKFYPENFSYLFFASSTIPGIKRTTSADVSDFVNGVFDEDGKVIIFTTYISFPNLLLFIKPEYVFFDEFHRFKDYNLIEDDIHYLGLSATPPFSPFNTIVRRSLSWAIESGILCDYVLNLIVYEQEKTAVELVDFLMRQGDCKKLLVINRYQAVATDIAESLDGEYAVEAVISKDSYTSRRTKENRVEKAEKGVLSSVNIYKEGSDKPWLDGLLYTVKPGSHQNMIQSFGRVLRKHEGKEKANVYFACNVAKLQDMLKYLRKFVSALKMYDNERRIPFMILADNSVNDVQYQNVIQSIDDIVKVR